MQRIDTIARLICSLYFTPSIEEVVVSKQRAILIVYAIADYHKSIIAEQFWYIPTIAHSQLHIGIHDGSIRLHSALKFQHHHWQTVYIYYTIRNTLLRTFYLQLVHHFEDITIHILKVNHLNEQVRLRGIFALDGESLCHQPIGLRILHIEWRTIISCQLSQHALHLQWCYSLLAVSVHQIHL